MAQTTIDIEAIIRRLNKNKTGKGPNSPKKGQKKETGLEGGRIYIGPTRGGQRKGPDSGRPVLVKRGIIRPNIRFKGDESSIPVEKLTKSKRLNRKAALERRLKKKAIPA